MVVWNLNDVYDFKETGSLIEALKSKVESFKKFRKEISPELPVERFNEILKKLEEIKIMSSKLYGYASLWTSENTADSKRLSHESKLDDFLAHLNNDILFFSLWFKDLDDSSAEKFINSSGKYRYYLEFKRLFKPNTLNEASEKIITIMSIAGSDSFSRFYDIVTNRFLFEWEGKKLPQEIVKKYVCDKSSDKRSSAYKVVLSRYKEESPILGEVYKSIVNSWRNENLKLRNFSSPISVRNKYNDISDETIKILLEVVRANVSLFQEYFKLKFKLLNLGKPDRFHLYAPFEHPDKEYSFEESKKICLDAFKSFSEDAGKMSKQIFDENHIHSDIIPNKQSGAFCYTILNTVTPYVLLNHANTINDLSTMMHELGHAVHGLAAKDQTAFTFHSALPLAETASIFSELVLLKKMLKSASDEEKIYLLAKELDNQYASIVRQAFFILFEIKAHDMIAEGATIEELDSAYLENLKGQFGDMIIDELFSHEWKYIPHIYHSPFYCYAYAFGNLLVLSLYKMYEKEGESFVPKFMKILSAGGSDKPENILKSVGIDINSREFWESGFDVIRENFDELKKLVS